MKFSFSKSKKYDRFGPKIKYVKPNPSQQTFEEIAKNHSLSEPFMYETAMEEDFTDFDPIIKRPNK